MADFRFFLGADKVRYIFFIKKYVQLMEMNVLRAYWIFAALNVRTLPGDKVVF